ncbi:hypothetical protein DB346_01705 [Verrucomicrobia bacterium LW23]|nr:hypothetical protein DB346_01705 [Verrucomicrobia bacterium LW23]
MSDAAAAPTPKPARNGGETAAHRSLKTLAAHWARDNGLTIAAAEVSFPYARFRADLAAYRPYYKVPMHLRGGVPALIAPDDDASPGIGLTAVFECKQARSDLLKDAHDHTRTADRLKTLVERKSRLEALLKVHCPHLAHGDSLFPEYDSYHLEVLEHKTYAMLLRKIRETQSALSFKTKFSKMMSYRLAHMHYLVMEPGIIKPHETPLGWGLLVREPRQQPPGDTLRLVAPPARQTVSVGMQLLFLQCIATAAGRGLLPYDGPGTMPETPVADAPVQKEGDTVDGDAVLG